MNQTQQTNFDKEAYFKSIGDIAVSIKHDMKYINPIIGYTMNDSKEKMSDVITFAVQVKVRKAVSNFLVIIHASNKDMNDKKLTMIINATTGQLLFSKESVDSSDIALSFLNNILSSQVNFLDKKNSKSSTKKLPNKNNKKNGGKKNEQ